MSQNSRTTLTPVRPEPSSELIDRLLSQFPELSPDEAAHAAAGVSALPGGEPVARVEVTRAPPRYRA